jgi:hypothetical protein
MHVDFLRAVQGGFFLRKKPLECVLSAYTNSENAITGSPWSAHPAISAGIPSKIE